MSWIDVAILALVVLMGLVGVLRGVKKGLLAGAAFIIAFLLAFFLSNVIAEALLGIDGVKAFVLGNGVGEGAQWSLASFIYDGLSRADLAADSALYTSYYQPIMKIIAGATVDLPAEQGLALYMAFMLFSSIVGVGIFIVSRLLLGIVTLVIRTFLPKKKSLLSRLFGFLVGAVRGAMWAFSLAIVFSCISGLAAFTPGIDKVQAEFHNNAVMCKYFEQGAYGMRDKLLLPDSDAYGRIVEMVYKKESADDPDAEKLSGDRLNLFVNLSNLRYENSPWSVDENRRRAFDAENATLRDASEFASVNFDGAMQNLLDYLAELAATTDDTTKATELTTGFTALNGLVQSDSIGNLNQLMRQLWSQLRTYADYYAHPNMETDVAARNSALVGYYNDITATIGSIELRCNSFHDNSEDYATFPDIELPLAVRFAE